VSVVFLPVFNVSLLNELDVGFTGSLLASSVLAIIHLLEAIRVGIKDIDKKTEESIVTELSSVHPMTDSELECLEIEQRSSPRI
jgi:hypothetical protein